MINAIRVYISNLNYPTKICRESVFRNRSYARWAAIEILYQVETDSRNPLDVVEDFAARMNQFSLTRFGDSGFIFAVAFDTAMDIVDQLLLIKGEQLL